MIHVKPGNKVFIMIKHDNENFKWNPKIINKLEAMSKICSPKQYEHSWQRSNDSRVIVRTSRH